MQAILGLEAKELEAYGVTASAEKERLKALRREQSNPILDDRFDLSRPPTSNI